MLVEYLHDGARDQRLSPFFVPKFFRKIFQGTHRHVAAGLSAIAQSNIRGEGCLILIIEVGVIPNRDLWLSVRNPYLPHLRPEIFPPYGRQNDMRFQGRQPFVISSKAGGPTRNLLLPTRNGGDCTLAWREILLGKAFQNNIAP